MHIGGCFFFFCFCCCFLFFFFFNDTATTEIYTLSLHDALPISYDIDPPDLAFVSPLEGDNVNHTVVGFSVGENLQNLTLKWVDSKLIEQLIILPEKYFLPDQYTQVTLREPPELVTGENYTIQLSGTDMAGNVSSTQVDNIQFDNTPPSFSMISPNNKSFQNDTRISFNISEPLIEGQIIWNAIGGTSDPLSPRTIELSPEERMNGLESPENLINQSTLQDGTIYQLSIKGVDLAGNTGSAILANNIHYDIFPPNVQLLSPSNDAYVNHDDVEFSISENLISGKITWSRNGGGVDSKIHEVKLEGDLLSSGKHSTSEIQDLPLVSLVDYKVEILGIDLAGNSTNSSSSRTIHYDTTPPILELIEPTSDSFINQLNVAYTVSEPLIGGYFQIGRAHV